MGRKQTGLPRPRRRARGGSPRRCGVDGAASRTPKGPKQTLRPEWSLGRPLPLQRRRRGWADSASPWGGQRPSTQLRAGPGWGPGEPQPEVLASGPEEPRRKLTAALHPHAGPTPQRPGYLGFPPTPWSQGQGRAAGRPHPNGRSSQGPDRTTAAQAGGGAADVSAPAAARCQSPDRTTAAQAGGGPLSQSGLYHRGLGGGGAEMAPHYGCPLGTLQNVPPSQVGFRPIGRSVCL